MRCVLLVLGLLLLPLAPAGAEPLAGCPAALAQRLPLPASAAALKAGEKLTIIAFGSSSTEGSGASARKRSYPARLQARLRAALPGVALEVVNQGRGGQTGREMLARLETDVVAARPQLVVWQAGANDLLLGRDPAAFRAEMEQGLGRLRAAGIDVVLMDSQRAPRVMAMPDYAAFDGMLRDLAAEHGIGLFSRAALMREWAAAGVPASALVGADGLHHNDRGYDCVAAELARDVLAGLRPTPVVARR